MHSALSPTHALLALAVVAVWGTNFVVIREVLDTFTPLWLAALRFTFVVVPAVFFLPRPAVALRELAAYGVLIGAGQFGLLFLALHGRISPGLASLVVQMQVFFTIALAVWASGERLRPVQGAALVLAAAGLAVIAAHLDAHTTPIGLLLVLGAALSWAMGNQVNRRAGAVNMLAYVVWSSLFAVPPLLAMAWFAEGPQALLHGVRQAGPEAWAAVLWQSVGNTMFGYSAWGWLLLRHPAATVTPWALLVPVFGMGAAAVWLQEPLPGWKIAAAALVVAGLALNVFAPRLRLAAA